MSLTSTIIGAGRNIVVPSVGYVLNCTGAASREIETRVIQIVAGHSVGDNFDITSDVHLGGVRSKVDRHMLATQKAALKTLTGQSVTSLDLGDLLTQGTLFWRAMGIPYALPTKLADIYRTASFWEENAKRGGGITHAVRGNHERDMVEKAGVPKQDLERMFGLLKELGVCTYDEPLQVGKKGDIQLLQMPCFNTSSDPYSNESMASLLRRINEFQGFSVIITHNPDGVAYIENYQEEQGVHIQNPALFLCGHTHGLLGFPDLPKPFNTKLSNAARGWLKLRHDTQYVSGMYPMKHGGHVLVHKGMGDQKGLFRIKNGGYERIILHTVPAGTPGAINLNT